MSYYECHGHIFMDGHVFKEAMELHRNGVVREVIDERLGLLREAGVTYYRDGGDKLGASLYARSRAEEYGIEYRTCAFGTHKRHQYGGLVGLPFDTAADFRALVAKARELKADFIKLMISGIMDFQSFGGLMGGGLEPEEIPELIKIAHGEGFRVMAHVNGAERIKTALEAGLDSVEHGYFMDEECLMLLKETGAVWVPTLAATAGFAGREGFVQGVAEANLRHACENLRKAKALGVLVAAGSDAGAVNVPPDRGIHIEHTLLAAAGLEPEDVRRGDEAIRRCFVYGG
jgi:hypothetical protein